jgi:hypothetical protein
MSELGDELHRLADEGAEQARPLPPSQVIRRGDRRRHGRIVRNAAGTLAVAGAITAGVVVGVAGGGPPAPAQPAARPVPATRQATPQATRQASPQPTRPAPSTPWPVPTAVSPSADGTPTPSRSRSVPVPSRTRSPGRPSLCMR